jgi:hypothetical protein
MSGELGDSGGPIVTCCVHGRSFDVRKLSRDGVRFRKADNTESLRRRCGVETTSSHPGADGLVRDTETQRGGACGQGTPVVRPYVHGRRRRSCCSATGASRPSTVNGPVAPPTCGLSALYQTFTFTQRSSRGVGVLLHRGGEMPSRRRVCNPGPKE